jgi:uncharacterized protein (TIGR02453 family)
MSIKASTLQYLKKLAANNDREWFKANKSDYEDARLNVEALSADLMKRWSKHEELPPQEPRKTLFRIYRDTRFSKDKTPYKKNMSMHIRRQANQLGFYIHIEPGDNSLIGTGIWQPSPQQLAAVRQEMDYNTEEFRKILAKKRFRDTWGELRGDELKTAPKGYAKDHPEIDLIRKKQWMIMRHFQDSEVQDPRFAQRIISDFKIARDFMDFLSRPLQDVAEKN